MILRNPLNFFIQSIKQISAQGRKFYINSNYYDNKISKNNKSNLVYKQSQHILSSLIKYQSKKINVDDISTEDLWENKNINAKDFVRLNN